MNTWPLSRHVVVATLDPSSLRSSLASGFASPRAEERRSLRRGSCPCPRSRSRSPSSSRGRPRLARAGSRGRTSASAASSGASCRPRPHWCSRRSRSPACCSAPARPRRSRCRPWCSVPRRSRISRRWRRTRPSRGGSSSVMPDVVWRDSISLGLPYQGRLIDGVQLPAQSPLWTTWDPALDRVPDRGYRRYGSAKLIHLLLAVAQSYHADNPNAPRLVIGDISRYGGGPLDEHVSHQNGLDVDVYYPRIDGRELRAHDDRPGGRPALARPPRPLPRGQSRVRVRGSAPPAARPRGRRRAAHRPRQPHARRASSPDRSGSPLPLRG